MTFAMENDEVLDPIHIGLFCAVGIMFCTDGLADLIQQFWGSRFHNCLWKMVIMLYFYHSILIWRRIKPETFGHYTDRP